jgi:phosphosulfolactate synthase
MHSDFLESLRDPHRSRKPREVGLTHVLDKGLSLTDVEGMLEVGASYIDIVKLGWGTAAVIENFRPKLELYRRYGIDVCCGGSLFEVALSRNRLDDYVGFLRDHGFRLVEISDGVIELPLKQKLQIIERLTKHFRVLSEVGSKDANVVVAPYRWVQQIRAELEAGAWKVVTEGRESGTVGLYRQSGEIRTGLIEEMEVQIDTSRLIFEAPQKAQQVWLVKHFGCNVNLGNIAPQEVISLETIRQGLRADTMGGNGPH